MIGSFIKINDYAKRYNVLASKLYYYARTAVKKGLDDRSRVINGKYYIHRDYKEIEEREINEMINLYHEALEALKDDESLLIKLVYLKSDKSHMAVHMYFRTFKFTHPETRNYYKEILKEIIKDNPLKEIVDGDWVRAHKFAKDIGISSSSVQNFYKNYQESDRDEIFTKIDGFLFVNRDRLKKTKRNSKKAKQYISLVTI